MSVMQKGFLRDVESGKNSSNKDKKPSSFRDDTLKLLKDAQYNELKALAKLRSTYSDDKIVQERFDQYKTMLERLKKKAYRFKEKIYNKYGGFNLAFPVLVKKAKKFIKKYSFSEEEFDCFLRFALADSRLNSTNIFNVPNTEMSKTLGFTSIVSLGDKLKYSENERQYVDNILQLYEFSKPIHEQVKLQTILYNDTATQALTGEFTRNRQNPYSYVHPVIAAMFLPKVRYLEDIMLLANIGNIVKSKKEGYPITTKPDYELYWSMITDPNDIACSHMRNSPLKDLELRFMVQIKLWEAVLLLRQGRYYDDKLVDFVQSLDNCPNNVFDAPDLTYVKDEGTILRKLLGVFSLRPTVVNVIPQYSPVTGYTPVTVSQQITSIPMMTLYLPPRYSTNVEAQPISFNAHMNQPRWFIQNKMIVPKTISLVYSRDVFFLYVPRRFYNMDFSRFTSPFSFNRLPVTISGAERLNDTEFEFQYDITIFDSSFNLRSVVFSDVSKDSGNIIIGTSAGIISQGDPDKNQYSDTCFVYSPQDVFSIMYDQTSNQLAEFSPMYWVEQFDDSSVNVGGNNVNLECFSSRATRRGTIFMYAKVGSNKIGLFAQD